MGILGGLFGRSSAGKGTDPSRCMECGMTSGSHTDWCTAVPNQATAANSATSRIDPSDAGKASESGDASEPAAP